MLTEQMPAVIWSTDVDFRITSSLGAGLGSMNRRPDEAVGRTLLEYLDTLDPGFPPVAAHHRALQGESVNYDLEWGGRTFQAHVEPLRDDGGSIAGTIGVALDITDRKQAEDRLLHAVFHDGLTGLPNRALFLDRMAHALEGHRHKGQPFATLLLDLDRFKHVNDGLGHLAGDRLLVAVAQRLRACVRPQDTVARFGGDEFTVLLEDIEHAGDAIRVAERIHYDLSPPFDVDGHEVVVGASVGIAISAKTYQGPEEVLRDADTAMYRAKARGGGCCQVFDEAMRERAVSLLRLEMELRRAVERQELRLHYQPIVSLADDRFAGFEGLVRWHHPRRGLVLPSEFIPLAEETGLILPIGRWVFGEGCRQMQAWEAESRSELPWFLSLNLSGKQLLQPNLVEDMGELLRPVGALSRRMKVEVTEDVLMENEQSAGDTLARLRDLHLGVSIDDFGTGHSSLSHLNRLPVDTLKIDRSFVGNMCHRRGNLEIVRTIVALAHNLSMHVVAEGVETAEQLAELRAMGCDYGQGYLYSRPVDARDARTLMER
jgi:diguanylate cyclase (GGDEF)-like protein